MKTSLQYQLEVNSKHNYGISQPSGRGKELVIAVETNRGWLIHSLVKTRTYYYYVELIMTWLCTVDMSPADAVLEKHHHTY